MKTHCVLSCLLLAACGQVSDPDNSPDGGTTGPDETPPAMLSSTPADGARQVSVLAPIRIVMDEPLDPASIDAETISVADSYDRALKGTATYEDDTNTLVFTPELPSYWAQRYTVNVQGMRDMAGNESASMELTFHTYVNSATGYTSFGSQGIQTRVVYTLDSNGHPSRIVQYAAPGADGQWDTSDDVQSSRVDYVYEEHLLERLTSFDAAGPDGLWGSADDNVNRLSLYTRNASGFVLKYKNLVEPGPDGAWGTTDDVPNSISVYTRHADNTTESAVNYNGSGPDGLWETADDSASSRNVYSYIDRKLVRSRQYMAPGPDGLWATADDVLNMYTDSAFDENGHYRSQIRYNGPGPDQVWFNADDQLDRMWDYDFRPSGLRNSYLSTTSSGPDGVWRTADDVAVFYATTYDAVTKQATGRVTYGLAGSDGVWGTADDEPINVQITTYDANGNRTANNRYTDAGPDGVWFTADDQLQIDYTYNTSL